MKTMYHCAVLGLFCLSTLVFIADGRVVQEDAVCLKEHGKCTLDMYENVRLLAQRSSGCRNFCQCAHASTQLDGTYTYMWVKHECPLGTLFDDTLPAPVCNHEFLVKCEGTSVEDECLQEHGECSKFTYENIRLVALKSSGCAEFCQCEHASTQWDGSVTYKWAKHVCPAGTLFDESLPAPVCNHANQVQCSGNNNNGGNDNGGTGNGNVDNDNGNGNSNGAGGEGGENSNGDSECQSEHGVCNQYTYENIRLLALKSSGCAEFCQCEHASTQSDGSVTYRWAKQVCPSGTLFDENLPTPVCNHASQVQCNGNNNNEGNDNDGTGNGSVDNDNGNGNSNGAGGEGGENSNGDSECQSEHGVCNQFTYENIRLLALKSSGCAEFCQCEHASTQSDGSVTYRWAKQVCPPGTLFDENLPTPVCNHASQVQCNGNNNNGNDNSGEGDDGDGECQKEHGVCNQHTYENIRLLALKSSGCAEFCQCEHASTQSDGSVTYRWAKQVCPPGTLFDESLPAPVCNHENQVQCSGSDADSGVVDNNNDSGNIGSGGGGGNGDGGEDGENGNGDDECQREHGVCNQYTYENVRLVALKSSECSEFCQCEYASTQWDGSVTYRWAKHSCPAGTLFDESLPTPVCNHASLVQCEDYDDEDDCEWEHGTCNQATYENIRLVALKSSGCAEFCQCEYASTQWDGSVTYKWAKHVCPAGTLFDEKLPAPVCNYAYQVQCDGDENVGNGNEGTDSGSNNNDASNNSDSESDSDNDSDSKESGNETSGSDTETTSDTDNSSNGNDNNSKESGDDNNSNSENSTEEQSSKTEDSENDSTNNDGSSKSKSESAKSSKSTSKSKSNKSSTKSSKNKSKSDSKTTDSDDDSSTKNSESKDSNNDSQSKSKSGKSKSKSGSSKKSKGSKSKSNSDSNSKQSEKETKSTSSKSDKGSGSKSKSTKSSKSKSKSGKSSGSKSKTDNGRDTDDVEAEDELQEVTKPMQCYKCQKEFSNSVCNEETEECSHNKQSCQTIVEWRNNKYEVRKGCKNPTANTANAKLECKKTGSKILCRYECKENLCNKPLPPIDLND